MKTKVEVCHIDANRCVVRVIGFDGELLLGSSLGEADNAELAEDRARQRLIDRFTTVKEGQKSKEAKPTVIKVAATSKDESNAINKISEKPLSDHPDKPIVSSIKGIDKPVAGIEPSEAPTDPEDWSEELTSIDMQLKRIGWNREKEHVFLERAYGHGSRHKLTRYSDILAYLTQLSKLEKGANENTAPLPIRRSDLIVQGDAMLTELGWTQENAKKFLQTKTGATTRQQLSDEQLVTFNLLLEEQLIHNRS